jgi:hypothetical protein
MGGQAGDRLCEDGRFQNQELRGEIVRAEFPIREA